MVKEALESISRAPNWAFIVAALSVFFTVSTFAIQIGAVQTHVEINGGRITILETERKILERELSLLIANNKEQERRLAVIEHHDVETREVETRMIERLSKLEAR